MNKDANIWIFFDGNCGLCHFFVRFVLQQAPPNHLFMFASQNERRFRNFVEKIPDLYLVESIVVHDMQNNQVYMKGKAVSYILCQLKWPWSTLGKLIGFIPTRVANFFYDLIAKIRRTLFKNPDGSCPTVPEKWRRYLKYDHFERESDH